MKKTALITGTGKGIGKAFAELLLDKGYIVFGYSRSNIIEHSHFTFTNIDLSSLQEIQEIQLPTIDSDNILLINNASSIGDILPLDLKNEISIIKEYSLNIITPTILCSKFINTYADKQKMIINIGSGAANNAIASWNTYCASKSALDMLTKVICEENHKKLNVFSIHPGIVDTNMQKKIRSANPKYFPLLSKFTAYHNNNELENTSTVAQKLYYIIQNFRKFPNNILSVRDINLK